MPSTAVDPRRHRAELQRLPGWPASYRAIRGCRAAQSITQTMRELVERPLVVAVEPDALRVLAMRFTVNKGGALVAQMQLNACATTPACCVRN